MQIRNDASVFLTDGRKALLLRNAGDAVFPDLRVEQKWEHELAPDHDIKSDAPGRTFPSHAGGARRSSFQEPDRHKAAETLFLTERLAELNRLHDKGLIKELIVVAPPRMLGEFRKAMPQTLKASLKAEITKDLVKHPLHEIEHVLVCVPETQQA